jgi:hypothetical protein
MALKRKLCRQMAVKVLTSSVDIILLRSLIPQTWSTIDNPKSEITGIGN